MVMNFLCLFYILNVFYKIVMVCYFMSADTYSMLSIYSLLSIEAHVCEEIIRTFVSLHVLVSDEIHEQAALITSKPLR